MIYGFCLLRLIHYIVALRLEYPEERILISKYDFSDAYRRVAHSAAAAAQTILIVGEIAYIMLSFPLAAVVIRRRGVPSVRCLQILVTKSR